LKAKLVILAVAVVYIAGLAGCGAPGIKSAPTAGEQFLLAKKDYDKKNYLAAIEGFQRTIFNFPGATIVDTAQYYLALSYYGNEEYELAAVEFGRLMANYPRSDYNDDAQFLAGMCYIKNTPGHYALDQEDLKKAITSLEDFIIDNPDSPLAEEARKAIGEAHLKLAKKEYDNGITYFKIYDYRAARVYFQYVVDEYTDTQYAPLSLYKIGESFFKEDKFTEARDKWNQFLNLFPDHDLAGKTGDYLRKISEKLADNDTTTASK